MEPNKALKGMLAIGFILFVIAASTLLMNVSLQKENAQLKAEISNMLKEKTECSPLGFCIGDKVEPTDDAKKRWNLTIRGVVRKIEGKVLTIDTSREEWQAVDEAWVRHKRNPFSICYGVPNRTTPDPTDWDWICDKGVSPPDSSIRIDENTTIGTNRE